MKPIHPPHPPHPPVPPGPPPHGSPGGPATDPQVTDWFNRIVANGGTMPSANTIAAANTFIQAIAGLRSRIYHLNIIAPDSLFAMRTPLIADVGNNYYTPQVAGTGVGDILTINGWVSASGPGNAIWYNTGVNPSLIPSFGTGNGGHSYYGSDNPVTTTVEIYGCNDGALVFAQSLVTFLLSSWCWSTNLAPGNPSAGGLQGGFLSTNRTANNLHSIYYANSSVPFALQASTAIVESSTPPNFPMYLGGVNNAGAIQLSGGRISFLAIHDGFTAADAQLLYNAVVALRTALGGGLV